MHQTNHAVAQPDGTARPWQPSPAVARVLQTAGDYLALRAMSGSRTSPLASSPV